MVRISKRRAACADMDSIKKAQKRAAQRNFEDPTE
ncbi:hypothetical protein ACP70R_018858 [Stipagrostis hirtigluma subsp. patula]